MFWPQTWSIIKWCIGTMQLAKKMSCGHPPYSPDCPLASLAFNWVIKSFHCGIKSPPSLASWTDLLWLSLCTLCFIWLYIWCGGCECRPPGRPFTNSQGCSAKKPEEKGANIAASAVLLKPRAVWQERQSSSLLSRAHFPVVNISK